MNDADEDFMQAMRHVRPLREDKARIAARKPPPHPLRRPRTRPVPTVPGRPGMETPREDDEQRWILRANGVSSGTLRQLMAGRPPVATTLDLHGCHRQEALERLRGSLLRLQQRHGRVLRVIHGRGRHSQDAPVLKSAVYHFLRESDMASSVLAVVPEPGSAGGACLVLLRRSRS